MSNPKDRLCALVTTAALMLAVTAPAMAGGGKSLGAPSGVVPATLEEIPGSDLKRVTLTELASARIDLKLDSVRQTADGIKVVPYSSLIYDPHGRTWIYTAPSPRSFVRAPVEVEKIDGDKVYLKSGPPVGTPVASTGVAEIYGAEFEVGH